MRQEKRKKTLVRFHFVDTWFASRGLVVGSCYVSFSIGRCLINNSLVTTFWGFGCSRSHAWWREELGYIGAGVPTGSCCFISVANFLPGVFLAASGQEFCSRSRHYRVTSEFYSRMFRDQTHTRSYRVLAQAQKDVFDRTTKRYPCVSTMAVANGLTKSCSFGPTARNVSRCLGLRV